MKTNKHTSQKAPFVQCPNCGSEWMTRESFLEDPNIEFIGYQVNFAELREGLFLFNHNCKTSLSILAGEFADLYNGPIFRKRLTGSKSCPGYCLHNNNLRSCPQHCECAFVRHIIQQIKKHPKKNP